MPLNLDVIQSCPTLGHEWTRIPRWASCHGVQGQLVQGQEKVDEDVPQLGEVSNSEGVKEEVREELHSVGVHNLEPWNPCGRKDMQSEVERWKLQRKFAGGAMNLHLENFRLVSLAERCMRW